MSFVSFAASLFSVDLLDLGKVWWKKEEYKFYFIGKGWRTAVYLEPCQKS